MRKGLAKPAPHLFSTYALHFATAPYASGVRPREAPGMWAGLDYLLKALTDVWRPWKGPSTPA